MIHDIYFFSSFNTTDKPAEENEGYRPNYPGRKAYRQPRVRQVLQSSLQ